MEALHIPEGRGRYRATELTAGPWFPGVQHGGPPAALLMREIESADAPGPMAVTRFTLDLLGPVPVGTLAVSHRVVRPGRRIQLVEATLADDTRTVAVARAWRMAHRPDSSSPAIPMAPPATAPPGPGEGGLDHAMPRWLDRGYHVQAVEKQFVAGSFAEPGPATAWMRLLSPVVEGETPTPMQRVAAVADFGSGLSAQLDPRRHLFINTDLTVAVTRVPTGEWVLLDAVTLTGPDGTGLGTTRVGDRAGWLGHVLQSLLVEPR